MFYRQILENDKRKFTVAINKENDLGTIFTKGKLKRYSYALLNGFPSSHLIFFGDHQ